MGEFSPWHWLLVAIIALLLFGPKKLPELGKGLAEGIRSFKDGMKEQLPTQSRPSAVQFLNLGSAPYVLA